MTALRVIIAEDSVLVRAGIASVLEDSPFVVSALCGSYDELLDAVATDPPNLVVTDIRMPPTSTDEGIRAAEALQETHPHIGVVVLSQYSGTEYLLRLVDKGSAGRGYLLKDRICQPGELADALSIVASGGSYIDPTVVDALVLRQRPNNSVFDRLTPREREVLAEIAKGKSNAAIAATLFVSDRAVEKHINSLFVKLDLWEDPTRNRRVNAALLFLEAADGSTFSAGFAGA
jgi:DNA-binding NarL/FixJ family response regulator